MSASPQPIPLSLEHQEMFDALWKPLCMQEDLQFAEYSFSNNYLFRRQHSYVLIDNDLPIVRGTFKQGEHYYIPTCLPHEIELDRLPINSGELAYFYPIPDKWLSEFIRCHPPISSCRANSDYVFKMSKIKALSGRALSSRRNLLHQLEAQHSLMSKVITSEEHQDALEVLEAWQKQSGLTEGQTDYLSCIDGLQDLERLGLFGRIAYADGDPVGFTIGELITPKTALMHFAKSIHSVKGITPYLYQDFARNLPDTVEWINLEEDLGIPALRKAKEAYSPDLLLTKWRVAITCHKIEAN